MRESERGEKEREREREEIERERKREKEGEREREAGKKRDGDRAFSENQSVACSSRETVQS